jgi:hypothetical protein
VITADQPNRSTEAQVTTAIFATCCQLAESFAFSVRRVSANAPFTAHDIRSLGEEDKAHVEAFTSRFAKLQDLIGAKLFRSILILDLEDVPPAMLDVLAAMEKRGLIENEYSWRALRNVRNDLSHNYRIDSAGVADNLNEALRQAPELLAILERVRSYFVRRGLTDLPPVPILGPPTPSPA